MTIKVTYNVTDVYMTQSVSPVYINVSYSGGGSSGGGVWGTITGTLSDQTDLQTALDGKFDDPTGTTAQYLRGDGSLATFPALTGYVPYSGATGNVNLGEYELKAGQLTLDVSPTGTAAVGTTRWNDTTGLTETTLKGGSVILKNGVDLVARVVNKVTPNTTLTKAAYQAVRVSGAQGQRLAVALAQANNDANSADTIGLVTETIATNQEGFIITVGQIENINTTGSLQGETWVDGDVLYLSPTIAGAITKVKPTGNGHIVVIGYVEYAHANNGKIYVKVMNGWELDELHDVAIVTPLNNEALIYESSSALWKNKSIATALGYTPANSATTLTINGVTFDLSANRTFTVGSVTGSGASGQVAYWTGASAQSGSNNLFWDNANGRLGIGTNTPATDLHINSTFATTSSLRLTRSGVSATDAVFEINNGTSGAGQFLPQFLATSNFFNAGNSTTVGVFFQTRITNANSGDIGLIFDARRKPDGSNPFGSPLTTGYIASFRSFSTDYVRIAHNGNMLLQNGGTFTDSGQRLQVIGDTLLRGSGATSATTALTVQNSSSENIFRVRNDAFLLLGNSPNRPFLSVAGGINGTALQLNIDNSSGRTTTGFDIAFVYGTRDYTSGNVDVHRETSSFTPTSGTGTFNHFVLNGTINQTGGANGITRGLYVNPTLTAAADFRAIETTNGKVIFGNLPTSSAGLPTGAIWNDAGTIKIV